LRGCEVDLEGRLRAAGYLKLNFGRAYAFHTHSTSAGGDLRSPGLNRLLARAGRTASHAGADARAVPADVGGQREKRTGRAVQGNYDRRPHSAWTVRNPRHRR